MKLKFKIFGFANPSGDDNDWTIEASRMQLDEGSNVLFYNDSEVVAIVARGAYQFIQKID